MHAPFPRQSLERGLLLWGAFMHKVAVLLDGGYVLWELRDRTHREATAAEIDSVARRCVF